MLAAVAPPIDLHPTDAPDPLQRPRGAAQHRSTALGFRQDGLREGLDRDLAVEREELVVE